MEATPAFSAAGAQVLALSVDSFAAANAFGESLGAEFPVLGDWPLDAVSRAYGVYDEQRQLAGRVTFVLDKEHIIRAVIDDARDMEAHSREALAVVQGFA